MTAATLAHGRFGRDRHAQLSRAGEADDLFAFEGGLGFGLLLWGGFIDFVEAEMIAAFLAERRVSAARLRLHMAAFGAGD